MSKAKKIYLVAGILLTLILAGILVFFQSGNFLKSDLISSGAVLKTDAAFTDYGPAATDYRVKNGTIIKEASGDHIFYGAFYGWDSQKFFRFNLDKNRVEDEHIIKAKTIWQTYEYKGDIYFGTADPAMLMKYSIQDKTLQTLATLPASAGTDAYKAIWSLAFDDEYIYMGTSGIDPQRYKIATGELTSMGKLSNAVYAQASAVIGKKVYMGFSSTRTDGAPMRMEVVEWNTETGTHRNILPVTIADQFLEVKWDTGGLRAIDGKLIISLNTDGSNESYIMQYDPATEVFKNLAWGKDTSKYNAAVNDPNRIIFSGIDGILYQYNKTTQTLKRVHYGNSAAYIDMDLARIYHVNHWGKYETRGLPYPQQKFSENYINTVMEGVVADAFFMDAYDGKVAVGAVGLQIHDTRTNKSIYKEMAAENKVLAFVKDTLYVGQYPTTGIWRFGPEALSMENNQENFRDTTRFQIFSVTTDPSGNDTEQTRPKDMSGSGNKLLIGTEPDYGKYGGAFTYYNTDTKERYTVRDIVPRHTIRNVVFDDQSDRYVYLGSAAGGGTGTNVIPEHARLIKWDLQEKKIVYDVIPEKRGGSYNYAHTSIVPKEGKVYILTQRQTIVELDAATGNWIRQVTLTGFTNLLKGNDGTIYVSGPNGFGILNEDTLTQKVIKADLSKIQTDLLKKDPVTGDIYMISDLILWKFDPAKYAQILSNPLPGSNENTNSTTGSGEIIPPESSASGSTLGNANTNTTAPTGNLNNNNSNLVLSSVNTNTSQSNANIIIPGNSNSNTATVPAPIVYSTSGGASWGGSSGSSGSINANTATVTETPINVRPSAPAFSDIASHFAKEAIEKLASEGIIQGRRQGYFEPQGNLNRAEAVKLVVAAFSDGKIAENFTKDFQNLHASYTYMYFPDVLLNAWYAGFVGIAKEQGIVSGTSTGTFEPGRNVTRAEFLKMVLEGSNLASTTSAESNLGYFTDVSATSWYKNYVYTSASLGLIDRRAEFEPDRSITRGEAAKILYQAMEK